MAGRAKEIALTARAFGISMEEVRRMTFRDILAYSDVLVDEARRQRMAKAHRRK